MIPEINQYKNLFKSYQELADQETHSKMLFFERVDAVISDGYIYASYNQKLQKENKGNAAFFKPVKFHHILKPSPFTLHFKKE